MRTYYICKYYFNASHSFQNNKELAHLHTFTIVLYVGRRNLQDETDVKIVDQQVRQYLAQYEGSYLNDLDEFIDTNASIEAIGDIFYEALKGLLRGTAFSLYQLDISDNPLSVYQVADRILLPIQNMDNSKENYKAILKQRKRLSELQKRGQ